VFRAVRATVIVLALLCLAALSACGGSEPALSPAASACSPTPTAELARLATRYRSSETTTEAWWVRLPLSEAQPVLGAEYGSVAGDRDPSSPVYLVVLNGGFTGGDGETHYDWAVLVSYADELSSSTSAIVLAERPDTSGHVWNPLPSLSPRD